MIVLSTLTGRWISKTGKYKFYAIAGMVIMLVSMVMLANMHNVAMAVISMAIFGIGLGMSMPVITLVVQNAVPGSQLGVATATSTLFRNLGGTIGIALFGSVMNSAMKRNLEKEITQGPGLDFSQLDSQTAEQFKGMLSPQLLMNEPKLKELQETLPDEVHTFFMQMVDTLRAALSDTLTTVFYIGTLLLAVALVLIFFLREIPLRTSDDASTKEPEQEQEVTTQSNNPTLN